MLWFGITPCCELVDHGPPLGPYATEFVYCYVVTVLSMMFQNIHFSSVILIQLRIGLLCRISMRMGVPHLSASHRLAHLRVTPSMTMDGFCRWPSPGL